MSKDTDKVMEMAKDIVNLKLRLLEVEIGSGNCPFAIYQIKATTRIDIDCGNIDCSSDCNAIWAEAKRKEIAEEVIAHYGLQEGSK